MKENLFPTPEPEELVTIAKDVDADDPAASDLLDVIGRNPVALQLRYLQTLVEIAAEKNSTTIFPIPIDTIAPFLKGLTQK